jgi:hypothetical protein
VAEIVIRLTKKGGKQELRGLRRDETGLKEINPATGRWRKKTAETEKTDVGDILPVEEELEDTR